TFPIPPGLPTTSTTIPPPTLRSPPKLIRSFRQRPRLVRHTIGVLQSIVRRPDPLQNLFARGVQAVREPVGLYVHERIALDAAVTRLHQQIVVSAQIREVFIWHVC